MVKDRSRSSKERVADTYWPLVIYRYKTLYGPFLSRVMACFFGCQPPSWFKADISKLKHDNIEAFLSPAYRRRFRNVFKKEWTTEVKEARREGINVRQMARETLSHFYEGLREELSGSNIEELSNGEIKANWPPFGEVEKEIHRIDLSRIPKIGQLQAEQSRKAEEIARDAEGAAAFFPIHRTLDASVTRYVTRNDILVQVNGREGYASTVAGILAEAETNPLGVADSIEGKGLIRLFHLEELEKELETMQFPQGFRIIGKAMGKCMKLALTQRIAAHLIGHMLIAQFGGKPFSNVRKKSLQDLAEKGWQLPDSCADEWLPEEGGEAIRAALAKRGIGYNDLTPREWEEIFEKYDLLRKGYEFSSKRGLSISSFYGEKAHAKEQKWSRVKSKVRKLSR